MESFVDAFERDRKEGETLSKEDKLIYENYKEAYVANYIKKQKEAQFIVMPFKVDNQYFLDFIPIVYDDNEINSLAAQHLLKTHSVAKLDMASDNDATLSWLSAERITALLDQKKIRIAHLKAEDMFETLLLTASSEELYAFLKKYRNAAIEDKWKASDRLNLTRSDAKP